MYLAPLNFNRFFIRVFSDPKISKRFLEDFLDIEIEEIEILKRCHKITVGANDVEFDFRCKIKDSYVIIDMQQWYKPDIIQRFYLYHAMNTGLQLETLPEHKLLLDKNNQLKEIKDYRRLEPVITLIWMVDDILRFQDIDYMAYSMSPEMVVDFIKNDRIWKNPEMITLLAERQKLLTVLQNNSKNLDFLPLNRLIFMFQKNIVKNKKMEHYKAWFEFAEKTRNIDNKVEDFEAFKNDAVFAEMIDQLKNEKLSDEDAVYIQKQANFWGEVKQWEIGIFEDGKKEGFEKGEKEGEKKGFEKGEKKGKIEALKELYDQGILTKELYEQKIKQLECV